MIKINFDYLDEGIALEKGKPNILVIESNSVFSKVMFSIYNHKDFFKIYDDSYKLLPEKNIVLILNPLLFDFQERNIKTMVYNYIANQLQEDMEFADSILLDYQKLANKITGYIETVGEMEFDYNAETDIKDLLKLIGLSINQDDIQSTFDKVQLIVNMLNEISNDKILIFMNLSNLVSEDEYKLVLDEVRMKSLTVLLIESGQIDSINIPYYLLDNDFCLRKT